MIRELALVLLGSCMLLRADEVPGNSLQQGIQEFNKAYRQWDQEAFHKAARKFQLAVGEHPRSAKARYWLGVAQFHRMLQARSQPQTPVLRKVGVHAMDWAIGALESATEMDPANPEAHAILATLYGMKIDGSLLRGMRYGRSVQKHHKLALEHGAKNPRVQYLVGTGLLHTADDDGDLRAALKALLLASSLYEAEHKKPQADGGGNWGQDACLAFIGQTYDKLGQADKAQTYYRKALRIRPNNHMAKKGLANSKN